MVEFWFAVACIGAFALVVLFVEEKISESRGRQDSVFARRRAQRTAEAAEREAERLAAVAAEKRQVYVSAKQARQEFLNSIGGEQSAALIQAARGAAKEINESEAARDGWLGDVDFSNDIQAITASLVKAQALRETAEQLFMLDSPTVDDRQLMDEAKGTAESLERAVAEQVELIESCASEARLIDESLKAERREANTAEQRAELHAKLTAMLYGVEATPGITEAESAAGSVMSRVRAYREIKDRIHRSSE